MRQYLDVLDNILKNGREKSDRTGTGTISLSGPQIKADLSDGFPLITTKETNFHAIRTELLWFLEKRDISKNPELLRRLDVSRYKEIGYGPDKSKWPEKTIWDGNASAEYWMPRARFCGDAGVAYGTQWRYWQKPVKDEKTGLYKIGYIDQVEDVLNTLEKDPASRRMKINGSNPAETDDMCLESCIVYILFSCNDDILDCTVQARSTDMFLGAPFDLASFAMLTHLIARVSKKKPGCLTFNMNDAHIYKNHIEQTKVLLSRDPYKLPKLEISPELSREHFDGLIPPDFIRLKDYLHHQKLRAQMSI
ncbi:MAG: thymidylate synthase [Rickettsiales bacterium]|jgi:thymidylate synthase|nr:thymidylate synthase [Rickettsiales bacterium]